MFFHLTKSIVLCLVCCAFLVGCPSPGPDPIDPIDPEPSYPPPSGDTSQLTQLKIAVETQNPYQEESKVMSATIQDELGEKLTFVVDSSLADAVIHLSVETYSIPDPATKELSWHASITTRAVRLQTGEQYWNFKLTSGERVNGILIKPVSSYVIGDAEARRKATRRVARGVAQKILQKIESQPTLPKTNEYTLQFIGFDRSAKQKIENTIISLEGEGLLKILQGGGSYGYGKFEYQVKWLSGSYQGEMVSFIKEEAQAQQVPLQVTESSPGIITFGPVGFYGGDE